MLIGDIWTGSRRPPFTTKKSVIDIAAADGDVENDNDDDDDALVVCLFQYHKHKLKQTGKEAFRLRSLFLLFASLPRCLACRAGL